MECEGRAFELSIEFVATRAGAVAWKVREALLDVVFRYLRKCFQGRVSHRCSSNRARHGEMSVQEDADHVNRANSAYRTALGSIRDPSLFGNGAARRTARPWAAVCVWFVERLQHDAIGRYWWSQRGHRGRRIEWR